MAAPFQNQTCEFCKVEFPLDRTNCPQCARPQLFPNVQIANSSIELAKLETAFAEQLSDADTRGCRPQVDQFAEACRSATAVFRCDTLRLHRQVASGTDIFEPYHSLERLRLRAQSSDWPNYEKLRPLAETELLGNDKFSGQMHYACLSLDGQGIPTYGDCVIQLAEPYVSHRVSCFEGNTAVLYALEPSFDNKLRSDWDNRFKICTAVMGKDIDSNTQEADFASILARPGPTKEEDVFIEVHVFGDMTAGTFDNVQFSRPPQSPREGMYRQAICEKLVSNGITFKTA